MSVENRSWQELCEAASKERDSEQLILLVSQLMRALDERRISAHHSAQGESRVVLPTFRNAGVSGTMSAD